MPNDTIIQFANEKYFIKYCKNHRIPISSQHKINEQRKLMLNYNFGIPLAEMNNKSYKELPELFKLKQLPSRLEKDLNEETEEILNLI